MDYLYNEFLTTTVMASRKDLKKTVNYIVGEIYTDCLVLQAVKGVEDEKVDDVLTDLLALQDDFLARCSHTEPGNVKGYYNQFYKDFNDRVDAIYAKIEAF